MCLQSKIIIIKRKKEKNTGPKKFKTVNNMVKWRETNSQVLELESPHGPELGKLYAQSLRFSKSRFLYQCNFQ